MNNKIRVLIVDDSAVYRTVFEKILNEHPDIQVVGKAEDAYKARDMIISLHPDVMTLDIEMPKMTGVEFLKKLIPQYAIPVVVCSSEEKSAIKAIEAGAVEFVAKPKNLTSGEELGKFGDMLARAVRQAKAAKNIHSGAQSYRVKSHDGNEKTDKIIAIGGSTGATEALPKVLEGMNIHTPPIICTIHMPEGYPKIYAERLNKQLKIEVTEVVDGMYLKRGMAVIARGSRHMRVYKDKNGYFVTCEAGPKVSGHCPSVDVMFESCAYCAKDNAIGVILTGMGDDGATGLLAMKKAGAFTIGQDEGSSLVYGMPKAAFELGAVDVQAPLDKISYEIYKKLKGK